MALIRRGSPQVTRFFFSCGPLIHQNLWGNDRETCPKCEQQLQLTYGHPRGPPPFSFTEFTSIGCDQAPRHEAIHTLLPRSYNVGLINLADFSMRCDIQGALASPNNV